MSTSKLVTDTSTFTQPKEIPLCEQLTGLSTAQEYTSGANVTLNEPRTSNSICTKDLSLAPLAINSQLKPEVGMVFHSEDQAYRFYNSYAKRRGFSVRKGHRSRRKDGSTRVRVFLCSNEGSRQQHRTHITKKPRSVVRTNCLAHIEYKVNRDSVWIVSKVVDEHNHPLMSGKLVHQLRSHRKSLFSRHGVINEFYNIGARTSQICSYETEKDHGTENLGFLVRNQSNHLHVKRARNLEKGDAQFILDALKAKQSKEPSFFYAVQLDDKERVTNFFWADARSIVDYGYFGDAVTFDTTYRTNIYDIPFAPFIGVNHHKQIVVFGAALLLDETVESFVWLFKTFIAAMSGKQPSTIFTDYCTAISEAVSKILPNTCHRLCLWQILKGVPDRLSQVCSSDPSFQKELRNCIYDSSSEDGFHNAWTNLITNYNLSSNSWLQELYAVKEKWALVYPQSSFSATIDTNEWSENMDNHFKMYFYRKLPPSKFIMQYHKSLLQLREKELFEDCESRQTKPVLLVDVPMLNLAAEVYTKRIYKDFEDDYRSQLACLCEPVGSDGSIHTFRVSPPQKRFYGLVQFNASDASVACGCKKFETMGLLCLHSLKVLNNNNILHLSSRYILKRWTKDAKDSVALIHKPVVDSNDREPYLSRYDQVWRKAITIASKSAASKEALDLVEHRLDKLMLEMGQLVYSTPNKQIEDISDSDSMQENTSDSDEICFDAFE